jgi:hypothetical protein
MEPPHDVPETGEETEAATEERLLEANGYDESSLDSSSSFPSSDEEEPVGDTFFPGHGEPEDVPYIQITTYPEVDSGGTKDFDASEALKVMVPEQFKEIDQNHWMNRTWLFGLGCNRRTAVISGLALVIACSVISGSQSPLQFPLQLGLIRLLILIQDCMIKYRGNKLGWHSLVS